MGPTVSLLQRRGDFRRREINPRNSSFRRAQSPRNVLSTYIHVAVTGAGYYYTDKCKSLVKMVVSQSDQNRSNQDLLEPTLPIDDWKIPAELRPISSENDVRDEVQYIQSKRILQSNRIGEYDQPMAAIIDAWAARTHSNCGERIRMSRNTVT
ncbi:hypothetical protein BDV98DRAFT_317321 [Pterulicium gracile]|uniref:Uncharacterized protein n=1 Tax=Pterulicium gracile TaxID=1884261 RepID=A0A5C3QR47_9AGAR|nr:hypothetical protein BDV98DRAFT_317321 [Pterula gracilis]